jgi:hypothetical protein
VDAPPAGAYGDDAGAGSCGLELLDEDFFSDGHV